MPLRELRIPRRDFLTGTAAGLAGLALGDRLTSGATASTDKRPNVLLIMSDEHNPHVTGCYGNSIVRTPNMDALAETGVTFENHYCNSPLCVPSRSSLTAGKYASRVDVWGLTCELPSADIPSLPRVMNDAGYESFLCGKQHYDYSRRYGFTEIGGNFNNTYKTGKGNRRRPDATDQKGPLSPRFDEFHSGDHGSTVEHDRKVTRGAVDFLTKREAGEKPFFLFVGYLAPHFPLIVPDEYWQRYKGKIDLPKIPEGFLENMPLNYKLLRAGFKEIGVPDDVVRRGRELYYGMTDWVDNEMGKVLAALRANKALAENTVIIYTSDHGENMGEHGMWWKNCMYEQASRVPLVVSWPKRWKGGQRRAGASAHVDLVKTVTDIAGGHTPDDWNGDSLAPWMDDGKREWKDFAVSEYYAHFIASGYVMARSGQWKYTFHTTADKEHGPFRELYDLSADPGEFNNLAAKPEHAQKVEAMYKRVVKEVGGDPEETELRSRTQLAKGYDRKDKKPKGKKEAEE